MTFPRAEGSEPDAQVTPEKAIPEFSETSETSGSRHFAGDGGGGSGVLE